MEAAPPAGTPPTVDGLTCVVRGMSASDVATALLDCRPLPDRQPHYARGSIPPERLAAVKAHVLEHVALPEDVFYDGRLFISMDGDKFEEHPGLEDALTSLLQEMNAEVDVVNAEADAVVRQAEVEAAEYMRQVG